MQKGGGGTRKDRNTGKHTGTEHRMIGKHHFIMWVQAFFLMYTLEYHFSQRSFVPLHIGRFSGVSPKADRVSIFASHMFYRDLDSYPQVPIYSWFSPGGVHTVISSFKFSLLPVLDDLSDLFFPTCVLVTAWESHHQIQNMYLEMRRVDYCRL